MKLNLPTAIVLGAFIVGWVVLALLGKPIPAWMAAGAAIVGKLLLTYLASLGGGSASGSGSGSASSSSSSGSATPPMSARLAYRMSARPIDTRLRLPRWVLQLRAFALCAAILFFGGRFVLACQNGVPTPPQTVQNVTIGLNAAVCVLDTYSKDMAAGKGDVATIADCVVRCGVTAAQATGLLDAHRKAETLEGADAGGPTKTAELEPDPAEDARKALEILQREGPPWYLEAMARARQAAATPSGP